IDFDARNKTGLKPIQPYLVKIDKIKNLKDLQSYLTEVTPIGLNPFYNFRVGAHMKNSKENAVYLGAANLGLGRAYYQKEDENNRETLNKYSTFIDKIYSFAGDKTKDLKGPKVIGFEKTMAASMLTIEQSRDAK